MLFDSIERGDPEESDNGRSGFAVYGLPLKALRFVERNYSLLDPVVCVKKWTPLIGHCGNDLKIESDIVIVLLEQLDFFRLDSRRIDA